MNEPNANKMLKKEILDRFNYRCEHRHNGWAHPECYKRDRGPEERIGCLDIESSNLAANFGVMLSYAIKEVGKKVITDQAVLSIHDINTNTSDSRIVAKCVEQMRQYDRIVGHYSSRFDIPFIRTRALKWNIDFPPFGSIYHTDVWRIARAKLRLHSNRQGCVGEALTGKDIKTRIHPEIWAKVTMGSMAARKKALAYIMDHNLKDVLQLEVNYLKLRQFVREGRQSI